MAKLDFKNSESIFKRAHYLANQMIFMANNDRKKSKGDPKVGGHSSGSSSALHIMGALHLYVKSGFDHIANKPHASPADHSFNYLLDLFLENGLDKMSIKDCNTAMSNLRAFSQNGEPVFQSYHSVFDPDHHNFFPSGTVGIPPVNAGYLALAYRFAKNHGYNVPDAHFWSLIGDAEFREGSLFEAVPDFAERELGNLTWIVDYNRQSLDGHRMVNKEVLGGTDATRISKTMSANGWEVIELQHSTERLELFKAKGGEEFKNLLENTLDDYTLQSLLLIKDHKELATSLGKDFPKLKTFLKENKSELIWKALRSFGGHDLKQITDAMLKSKESTNRPTMIIAHTLKGWGLEMEAQSGNHSALPSRDEMKTLRLNSGLKEDEFFGRFKDSSPEGKFLKTRGDKLFKDIKEQHKIKDENTAKFRKEIGENLPDSLGINLKMASYPHTQWMLGQLTSKLTRIANTPKKDLNDSEKLWKTASELMVSMAPDVGTSTNLNPTMDGKIFEASHVTDKEADYGVKDKKAPDLIPGQDVSDRFLRFEIAEANVMSCQGSFGRMRDILGIPLMPLMTVYDFFLKRAHDQFFYNLYWKSSFIAVGTPSGVTLSPEGAQHGWKSDFQIPNQMTWEPFFCQELDWIFCHSLKEHFNNTNQEKTGVLVRGVTRGAEQKDLLKYLKKQKRFKMDQTGELNFKDSGISGGVDEATVASVSEAEMFKVLREEVLAGAYKLIDYSGYRGYEPGDNVVNIFSLGSLTTEAIKASNELLKKGIYANVIVTTNTDLLAGNIAHKNNYHYLKQYLGINADLHLTSQSANLGTGDTATLSGRRIPIVSVHDGEPGLLDNLGSIVGVKHEALAVRKHSKCGRPEEIYAYHGIDSAAVLEACGKVLGETALEEVKVSKEILKTLKASNATSTPENWQNLWPKNTNKH
ncbi:MAG: pyruvate dehydrogenase [Bdellovibrionales bacterium]